MKKNKVTSKRYCINHKCEDCDKSLYPQSKWSWLFLVPMIIIFGGVMFGMWKFDEWRYKNPECYQRDYTENTNGRQIYEIVGVDCESLY